MLTNSNVLHVREISTKYGISKGTPEYVLMLQSINYPVVCSKGIKRFFDELEELGIVFPLEDQFFPWFIVYDFEAYLETNSLSTSPKLVWTKRHHPICVSICSNVPGFLNTHCIVDNNPENLVGSMLEYMEKISAKCKTLAQEKWGGD